MVAVEVADENVDEGDADDDNNFDQLAAVAPFSQHAAKNISQNIILKYLNINIHTNQLI